MDLQKYMNMPNSKMTEEMEKILSKEGDITMMDFSDKNNILSDKKLWKECGYIKLLDDSYLVSMVTPIKNVTKEMVSWWFWWHAQESERYKAWYPTEHFKISYHKKNREYFNSKTVPEFQSNIQYPVERIGKIVAPLSIEFVSPSNFGFSKNLMRQNNIETIVCGHVGAFKGLIKNTEMAHIFVQTEDGPLWISRFWIGKNLKSKMLKRILITENQARDMAVHCSIEYQNFAKKIPLMYEEWINNLE